MGRGLNLHEVLYVLWNSLNQTIWWLLFPKYRDVVDVFASVARCISKNVLETL